MTNNILQILFLLLAVTIPISVAGTNIIISLFVFFWILEGKFSEKLEILKKTKWIFPLILLLLFYIISFLFVGEQEHTTFIFQRLLLLLVLPIFISTELKQETLKKSVTVFFYVVFFSAVISILGMDSNWKDFPAFLKYNYHNITLAFSSILALHLLINSKINKPSLLIIFIIICSISIFLEKGRAGQLLFLLFFFIQILASFKKTPKYSFIIFGFIVSLLALASYKSDNFQRRVADATQIVQNDGINNSGHKDVRYTFFKKSFELIKAKPFFGYGTGTWYTRFHKESNFRNPNIKNHFHPHNNYLYIWFELGVFSLITFLLIFYFQIKELLKRSYSIYRITLPVILLLLMFIDSYFFVFNIMIMYIYFYTIYRSYLFK